ncbi:hypothetical protein [Aureibacter tunicatorum]|uniref:L-asparagine transporter-like permease n=1 Tax=Aureibacter tunicatorum TaxID=866807 RepID=A0AAE3XT02_9BACT|nr:hypothetical protein [Aureibacter tunicatorum]MDR6242047.1 L-asparagine transporter-like permease [Aureibacter tunicatorum]BDD03622.1 hypothetical protein AUTU_11050 [Aureibacter tunicatorum]
MGEKVQNEEERLKHELDQNIFFIRMNYLFKVLLVALLGYFYLETENMSLIVLIIALPIMVYFTNVKRLHKERSTLKDKMSAL